VFLVNFILLSYTEHDVPQSHVVQAIVQKALKNPTVPAGMEINVMEMIQQIREQQYDSFKKCKTVEEKIAFYREGARLAEERAKKRRLERKRFNYSFSDK